VSHWLLETFCRPVQLHEQPRGLIIETGPLAEGIQVAVPSGIAVVVVAANPGIFFGKIFSREHYLSGEPKRRSDA
jgi:hypothetical protein